MADLATFKEEPPNWLTVYSLFIASICNLNLFSFWFLGQDLVSMVIAYF